MSAQSKTRRILRLARSPKALWRVGIVLVVNISLCVFVLTSIRQIGRYQDLKSTLDQILIRTEAAQLAERNFLLNSIITEQFITTGEDPQIKITRDNARRNLEILEALSSSKLIAREELSGPIDSVYRHTVLYQVAFDRIVELYQQKGFRDWGLEGEMRDAIHYIEDTKLPVNMEYMLMLRRHEKDFLLRKDPNYKKKFQEGVWEFLEHLDQLAASADKSTLRELLDTLNHYESLFYQMVAIEEEIGLTNESGIKGRLTNSADNIDRQVATLIRTLDLRQASVTANLIAAIIILFLISTALLVYRTLKNLRQEEVIGYKNKDLEKSHENITASINYARRIQSGILSNTQYVSDIFSEVMIIYRPRDIVSGDFYWFAHKDEKVIIAVVDCTGHGVPGAFMTVLANALLNQVVIEKGITDPSDILRELDDQLIRILGQGGSDRSEGMDLGILSLNVLSNELEFGGAKNNLYLFQNGHLRQVKGDKFSIGSHKLIKEKHFATHKLHLNRGDALYLFTDGFPDQFGGPDGRKYLIKNFRNLLCEQHSLPLAEQQENLEGQLDGWMRASHPQTDDITVLGLRY